jgi:hypothetical protein
VLPSSINSATRGVVAGLFAATILFAPPAARAQSDHDATPAMAGMSGHDHEAMDAGGFSPQLTIHGFSDVTAYTDRIQRSGMSDSTGSGAIIGQFDLYLVSRLAENLSFLGEAVFETQDNGEVGVDLERMYLRYAWSDYFHLAAGRTHTALGYWNEVFHHGSLLQPTVERPEALKFEDDGGILPVHSVGFEVGGRVGFEDWATEYVGNVGNGRAPRRDLVQNGGDSNGAKSAGLKLSLVHSGSFEFAAGPAVEHDVIPPDPGTPGRDGEIDEAIVGIHGHCKTKGLEVLAEYYGVRHEDRLTSDVRRHEAGYAIAIAELPHVKPYAGFDRLVIRDGDAFYGPDITSLTRGTLGLRFEPSPFNAIKLELRHDVRPGEKRDAIFVQTAFTF